MSEILRLDRACDRVETARTNFNEASKELAKAAKHLAFLSNKYINFFGEKEGDITMGFGYGPSGNGDDAISAQRD